MRANAALELMEKDELQRLQEDFCRATGVCAYCLDGIGQQLTKPSGTPEQLTRLRQYSAAVQIKGVLERVEDGSLEDIATEELEEGDLVAAVAVRAKEYTALCWVVFGFAKDGAVPAGFADALDLLRSAGAAFYGKQGRDTVPEPENPPRAVEAITEMVRQLDSDERIELVADRWLGVLAEYLRVDSAWIFRRSRNGGSMDLLCEWCAKGIVSSYEKTSNLPVPEFLQTGRPLVISSDGSDETLRDALGAMGLCAVMVFPLGDGEDGSTLLLSLNHSRQRVEWRMPEIRFTADAVKIFQSILTRRFQKKDLAGSRETLKSILDNLGCAVYVTEKDMGKCLFANRKLQNTFAKELKDGTFPELLQRGVSYGRENGLYEIHHMERERWYDLTLREITWLDGTPAEAYSLYDITDKKLYQRKVEQQAYTDFLTGLYNRMCCERDLARQIDQAKKTGETGALLYLDLDDFKHINDGLGHQYGDVLLKAISHSLQRVEGIQNTCYRMGGDEFVIVIPPEQYKRFDRIQEDICRIFAKPWFLKDTDYYCTMSMGIVAFPDYGDSVADLIKKADIAMYEAKKSGKNRVAWYREDYDSASGRRLDMEKNMRDATVDGYKEFEVYFQPIIDVQNGAECAGAEALIRWNSAKLGFIPPAEFIPLAEYLGLINPIGNYVLKEACECCHRWNQAGYPYKVNVNLSVVQLLQTDIVEMIAKTIQETGIDPKYLTLEVTESLAINDMDRMKDILERIKALGVQIALDDFGTGYSSLNHIREIPFDMIKVDQSFVKELAEDAYSQSFVKMVAELAETLGVKICVEGIETQAQYSVVSGMKVRYIQGFYFDRPMKCVDFEAKYCEKACNLQK